MNKMFNGLFKIEFEDNTIFTGNLLNKDWGKCPNLKGIKQIEFVYGDRRTRLEGFQEYNLTMEIHMQIGKKQRIVNITLAGRGEKESTLLIYDMTTGKVLKKVVEKYKEYGNIIGTTWKLGLTDGKVKVYYG